MSKMPGLAEDSAAGQVASIVWMKARMLKDNDLAEVDYEVEVEDIHGTKVRDSGTIRREPFRIGPNDG